MSVSTRDAVPNVIVTHPAMENHAENTQLATNIPTRQVIAPGDLDVLSNWVKKELFEKVKFLYDADKELRVNGDLYYLFIHSCRDKLIGLKGDDAVGEYRRLYVELLWQEANKKRRNLVTNGLTMRRSSMYSAMQNQFVGESRP